MKRSCEGSWERWNWASAEVPPTDGFASWLAGEQLTDSGVYGGGILGRSDIGHVGASAGRVDSCQDLLHIRL
jgi:hypothetical protein